MGKVQRRGVLPRDLVKKPTANFVVKYQKKFTSNQLEGQVACELSSRLYGAENWWVLLEKDAAGAAAHAAAGSS